MSAARRGSTDLSGVLILDKPEGITSHDVVSAVRRATDERRVGHAGTLDPAATGVLVVLVGPATRLAPLLTAQQKRYEATIVFGTRTDTDDRDGVVIDSAPVPDILSDPDRASSALDALPGLHLQTPPAYSAIKKGGRVAHRAARAGDALELEPRQVEIHAAHLKAVHPGPPLAWDVDLTVSKGTYIRSIARDLGTALGTAAHLGRLRRTASGAATLTQAVSLDELAATPDVRQLFVDPVPLLGLPVLTVAESDLRTVANGGAVPARALAGVHPADERVSLVDDTRLLAVYQSSPDSDTLTPSIVFPGGIAR